MCGVCVLSLFATLFFILFYYSMDNVTRDDRIEEVVVVVAEVDTVVPVVVLAVEEVIFEV